MRFFNNWGEWLDWSLAALMVLGIALYFGGTALNSLVLIVNDGSMPITGEPDILVNADGRRRHYAKEGSAKLLFLSDCIRINFPKVELPKGRFGDKLEEIVELVDYPIEGGVQMVSLGDLMRWIGVALFLLMIPPLLFRIPFRLLYSAVRKKN